jgi:serine/threonine protein kinase
MMPEEGVDLPVPVVGGAAHRNMVEILNYRNALPLGSMLLEYRLESVLGSGGFGMTYLAYDTNLELKVAIKEYLPAELALRARRARAARARRLHRAGQQRHRVQL